MTKNLTPTQSIDVVIVDDEKHCLEALTELLIPDPRVNIVAGISQPAQAVFSLLDTKPDLVFLDIHMPGTSGFDILRKLKKQGFEPAVIFVTAFDHYAIEAIKSAAFDYLLKPVEAEELQKSLDRFFTTFATEGSKPRLVSLLETLDAKKKIRFNNSGGFVIVNPEDIIYVEADWNYSRIFTGPDKSETVTMNIGAVEEVLPARSFMRISRSVIINLNYLARVKRLARKCILEKDGQVYEFNIPIGRIRELERKL